MKPQLLRWRVCVPTVLFLFVSIVGSAEHPAAVTITCPGDVTVVAASGTCGTTVSVPQPVVSSSVPVVSVTNSVTKTNDASGYYAIGKSLVTWTALNASGEVQTCSMYVIVQSGDTQPPVVSCQHAEVVIGESVPFPAVSGEVCEGYAARFVPADKAYISLDKDLGSINTFTYELFIKPNATHEIDAERTQPLGGIANQRYVIFPSNGAAVYGTNHSTIGISAGTNGVSVYEHSTSYLGAVLVYAAPIPSDVFTHIAVVFTSNGSTTAQCTLYINGVAVRTTTSPARFPFAHPNLGFRQTVNNGGIGGGSFGYYGGDADDIRVWNYARTAAEIAADMTHELTGNEAGLLAYLNLNEGTGTTASGPFGTATLLSNKHWVQPSAFSPYSITNDITGNTNAPVFSTVGPKIITWSVTDLAGNVSTCSSSALVTLPLSIDCPDDIVVEATPGVCGSYVNVPMPVISGGSAQQTIYNSYTNTLDASGNYPVGTTLVQWKVRKDGNVTNYCATKITVLDKQGPAIATCPSNVVQELSGCGSPVPVGIPQAQDNCNDGWGLHFDKVDDQINIDYDLPATDIFTYEFYVKPAVAIPFYPSMDGQNYVIYPGDGAAVYGKGHSIVGVSVGTNGIRVFKQTEGKLEQILQYPVAFPADTWTHVSLVIDKTLPFANCKFYVGGTYIHSDGLPSADTWHASLGYRAALAGGGIGGGTLDRFGGSIDEVRVWSAKRTVHEMAADRRRELTGLEPNLVAYYKFNEGAGSGVVHGSVGTYALENMDATAAWVNPDAIEDFTIVNDFNNSISASDMYPVGVTQVQWRVTDKFGNESRCANTVQVNNVGTVTLVCTDQTVNNTPERCDAPVTLTPPTTIPSSCEGYALNFDGENDRVLMEKDLGVSNEFTYEMWARPSRSIKFSGWGLFAEYAIYPGLPEYYGVPSTPYGLTTHSNVGITVGRNGVGVYEHSYEYLPLQTKIETTILFNDWTHIAVVYKNDSISIYINGVRRKKAKRIVDGRTVHANLGIPGGGGGIGGGVYGSYKGDLDEVRLWNYARTQSEIVRDKDIELKGTEAGLKAYFNFNEGNGNTIATSKFGPAELVNMDPATDWVQPDPIRDYTFSNSITGPTVTEQIFPVGENVVTWTLTDKYGATTTCSSIVTVVDAQAPIAECPDSFITYLPDGSVNTDVVLQRVTAYDNCGIKSITNNVTGGEDASGNFPLGTTEVVFIITDVNGNETVCPSVSVTIEPTKLFIPTGISPNGDGVNDAWILPGLEYFDYAEVKIYNRNGDMVFEAGRYGNDGALFHGESNKGGTNKVLPDGTYFYHLKTVPNNELKDFTGFLEISR